MKPKIIISNATFCLLAMVIYGHSLGAQLPAGDTAYVLPLIQVVDSTQIQTHTGSISQLWEVEQLVRRPGYHIADLLQMEAGVYIKSYGLGSLATPSIRGSSARHLQVLWNGLPVISPMLGLTDLSLLPSLSVERVQLVRGGSTSINGSGAIGGTLHLNSEATPSEVPQLTLHSEVGSFGHQSHSAVLNLGGNSIRSTTKLLYTRADNDFDYFVGDGLPRRVQTNAKLAQLAWMQDLHWRWNERESLSLHYWLQKSEREIPPTNVQVRSEARQEDLISRMVVEYESLKFRKEWRVQAAYFAERQDYSDPQILLESQNVFHTLYLQAGHRMVLNQGHQLQLGATQSYVIAEADGYGEIRREYRSALYGSWHVQHAIWRLQASLRGEWVNGRWTPIAPSVGIECQAASFLALKAKVSRNYQIPTLNDRYWVPGGNRDLQSESGWSQELSAIFSLDNDHWSHEIGMTGYNRNIDNWILWSPVAGQPYWSPNNIAEVWSRGLETRLKLRRSKENNDFVLQMGYDWVRSTNQVEITTPDIKEGEQLIYTPVHRYYGELRWQYGQWGLLYHHDFTGEAQGVNGRVEAFDVGRVRVQYDYKLGSRTGFLYAQVNNVWDADFIVIERRPMPGRHFQLGLRFTLN